MPEFPSEARCVVIGAGIVGNCLVGHLAKLGWTDLVLLDKGPLPNPGGSTGHASNFIFPVDHNKEMCLLGEQSANQYRDLGLSVDSGGIEVARTPERMDELQRRMTSAKAWGIEARLLTPTEVAELVPFVNPEVILGGFWCPTVSVVDSLETGTRMRTLAAEAGCRVFANTEVLDITTRPGPVEGSQAVESVVTDKGAIRAEHVVIACGVWSNRVANMAGARIPLAPAVHQMADVGPIDILPPPATRSATRSSETWTPSATSASRPGPWRWGPTPTGPSCTTPTTSPPTPRPPCRRRRCRSPPTTSTPRWSRPSS